MTSKKKITRNNHYVPIWYQKEFLLPNSQKLYYLDILSNKTASDSGVRQWQSVYAKSPRKCFFERDLYTTRLGIELSDAVEKNIFGEVDGKGAIAIRAFIRNNTSKWVEKFQDFLMYIDVQKFRTPKGIDWIRCHYHKLDQNNLMYEMQCLREINCIIWAEGTREIVSAQDSEVKFIITDHPVTIYNYACPPEHMLCNYPSDPRIVLKASQTLFPLDKNHCLILTNLEYAQDPDKSDPLEMRTNPRHIRTSVARTDKIIKTRKLTSSDVTAINYVLKSRARQYIAAGNKDWLWPEDNFNDKWSDIKSLLLPPEDELMWFGGDIIVGWKDGRTHYQDAYGRTKAPSDIFNKNIDESRLKINNKCGCGSGRRYGQCCKNKKEHMRPSWKTMSIRERNIRFINVMSKILGATDKTDWDDIRRGINGDKVRQINELYSVCWPPETDIFDLLPKPDGCPRVLYSGLLDPIVAPSILSNVALYFGDILVQNPFFINPAKEGKIYKNPEMFLNYTIRNIYFIYRIYPLIESGIVNLFPSPGIVDPYFQRDIIDLAYIRNTESPSALEMPEEYIKLATMDIRDYGLFILPREEQIRSIKQRKPNISDKLAEDHLIKKLKNSLFIPLPPKGYVLENMSAQMFIRSIAPNLEETLLIAQATGSAIVTDSKDRWSELKKAGNCGTEENISRMPTFTNQSFSMPFLLIGQNASLINHMLECGKLKHHRNWSSKLQKSLWNRDCSISEENFLAKQEIAIKTAQKDMESVNDNIRRVFLKYAAPAQGIYHQHIPRLMIQYGIKARPKNIPLAIFIDVPLTVFLIGTLKKKEVSV